MAVRIKSKRQVEALCQLAKDAIYRDNETPTLYLRVRETGSAQWLQIVHIEGKRVERGLGGWPVVTIDEAREVALGNRRALRRGENPFVESAHQARRKVAAELSKAPTFAEALEAVLAMHRGAWKNPKSEAQWRASLRDYAMPTLGSKRVDAIQTPDVLRCLEPIWNEKRETANRVKQRISAVMKWAVGKQYRADNPVAGVDDVLPKARNGRKHHDALPYCEVPAAIATVRNTKAHTATKMAFEFLVLTAARSGEVREATWDEIDWEGKAWNIPAGRMKAKVEHAVPLSKAARRILKAAAKLYGNDGLIFPSPRRKPLSDATMSKLLRENGIKAVPHGFRTSFRNWAGEQGWQRDLAEAALAHTVRNQVEAAYHRTDYLEQRRSMMAKWAEFCLPKD